LVFPDAAGLPETILASASRLRFRFAAFCLRTRLNLDLSPFTRDILRSCWIGYRNVMTAFEPIETRFSTNLKFFKISGFQIARPPQSPATE
jgi:hypothetical protein